MPKQTQQELEKALQVINETIGKCEKMIPKFVAGTSQHTLLQNRIKALHISKSLLTNENVLKSYTRTELAAALKPIASIISKSEKALSKYEEGTYHYLRLRKNITAMEISKSLLEAVSS